MDELFIIEKGTRLTKADQISGKTNFIGATAYNNGVMGHIGQKPLFPGNRITVAYNGSVGSCFYQSEPFWASDDINVLSLRHGELNEQVALFICSVLSKAAAQFSYTSKWNVERMKATKIKLPVTTKNVPDWNYMRERIVELERERIVELERYLAVTGFNDYTLTDEDIRVLSLSGAGSDEAGNPAASVGLRKPMKEFFLKDILTLHYGNKFDKNKMTYRKPVVNFVSRTAANNGVSDFVDIISGIAPYPGGTVTLAFGGSIGSCFLQDDPFYTGQNVGVIEFPDDVPHDAKLYFTEALGKVCKRKYVAFGDEINKHFKKDLAVSLPVTDDGVPDWNYMAAYIRAIEKKVIRGVVEYKDAFIAGTKSIVYGMSE